MADFIIISGQYNRAVVLSMATHNLTSDFFQRLSIHLIFCGLPNLSVKEMDYMKSSMIWIRLFWRVTAPCLYLFVIIELISFVTQTNLTEKQSNDRLVFGFSHPLLIIYYLSICHYKEDIEKLLTALAVALKEVYNDTDVEKQMIRKFKLYAVACTCSICISLTFYGFDALLHVIHGDGTFTTVITGWPKVEDKSIYANVSRIVSYLFWWAFMIRTSGLYNIVISLTVSLSYQYKNLQSYFYSLGKIFSRSDLTQSEKEQQYEESIKVGIQLHADTLWCTKKIQMVCEIIFSGQVLLNISVICLLMLQMMNSERTQINALVSISTALAVLISTGFFMWSAGDVTEEAAQVSIAMYSSGWENCRGYSSTKIRRLLVVAMAQSQESIVLRSFHIMELSYQSYVSIVKTTYSVFSILY